MMGSVVDWHQGARSRQSDQMVSDAKHASLRETERFLETRLSRNISGWQSPQICCRTY